MKAKYGLPLKPGIGDRQMYWLSNTAAYTTSYSAIDSNASRRWKAFLCLSAGA